MYETYKSLDRGISCLVSWVVAVDFCFYINYMSAGHLARQRRAISSCGVSPRRNFCSAFRLLIPPMASLLGRRRRMMMEFGRDQGRLGGTGIRWPGCGSHRTDEHMMIHQEDMASGTTACKNGSLAREVCVGEYMRWRRAVTAYVFPAAVILSNGSRDIQHPFTTEAGLSGTYHCRDLDGQQCGFQRVSSFRWWAAWLTIWPCCHQESCMGDDKKDLGSSPSSTMKYALGKRRHGAFTSVMHKYHYMSSTRSIVPRCG